MSNLNPFAAAYSAGWRAGATVRLEVVNGHKYVKSPVCPFPVYRVLSYIIWHEGQFNGTMQRLNKKGTL